MGVEFIHLNYIQIKLMRLIPKPHSLDLHLSISNGFVSTKTYDKLENFDFDIINYPVWMGTFPVLPLTVLTFLNIFDLLESLVM